MLVIEAILLILVIWILILAYTAWCLYEFGKYLFSLLKRDDETTRVPIYDDRTTEKGE